MAYKASRCRLRVEQLEDRLVPAIINVTTTNDVVAADGLVSLREAINQAAQGDTILLQANSTYLISIAGQREDANATGDFDITTTLTIEGAGAGSTIIDGGSVDGAVTDRVFDVRHTVTAVFRGVTITRGSVTGDGGGIRAADGSTVRLINSVVESNRASGDGGGIHATATLGEGGVTGAVELLDSTVRNNTSLGDGGGIGSFSSAVTIDRSTINGNEAGLGGGGIYVGGPFAVARITNSTISGNTSPSVESGGGIFVGVGNLLYLTNVTVTRNTSTVGGGIFNDGSAELTNSIVAGNTSTASGGPDLAGSAAYTSGGNNLIGDASGSTGFTNGENGDQVGPIGGTPLDPRLDPQLRDNGGPTATHALLAGSPAIDAGQNGFTDVDQRGQPRPADGDGNGTAVADIGAFEVQPPPAVVGEIRGTVFLDYNADGSRNAALEPPLPERIVFLDANGNGVLDTGETTAVTGTDGGYVFSGLAAGTYAVRQSFKPEHGTVQTGPPSGVHSVVVAGDSVSGRDFGNVLISQVTPVEVARTIFPPSPDAETAFVQGLYHNLLARDGETPGVAFWVQRLRGGQFRAVLLAEFWRQAEHRELQVRHYYHTFLHREPDPQGLADHVADFVQRGFSEADVVLSFLMAPEYQAQHVSDTAFIEGLYTDLLSFNSDPEGRAFWLQRLQAKGRCAIAHEIMNFDDSLLRIIDAYYAVFLHRAPETEVNPATGLTGRQWWLNVLRGGRKSADAVCGVPPQLQAGPQSLGAVGELFLASPEYFAAAGMAVI